jgi:hypothetical protein
MDEELEKKIEETHKLAKENNKILRGMRRSMLWQSIFRAVYWVIVLGLAIGAYYFLQPYFEALISTYNSIAESINEVREVGDKLPDLSEIPGVGSIFNKGE